MDGAPDGHRYWRYVAPLPDALPSQWVETRE